MKCIRFHEHGGPEVLRAEDFEVGRPGAGEAQIRQTAIGLNYIDVYDRTGLYPGELPGTPGREAAGVITALGRNTRGFRVGDRVAYVHTVPGAYCEVRNLPVARLVKIPKAITDEQAAAVMLKGLTAQFLVRRTHRVRPRETILVHAAAGGVGSLLTQWAKALGATVIGVVGSESKVEQARKLGCRRVLLSGHGRLEPEVRRLTRGEGVAVVYDSVGRDTFLDSLACLRPLGLMVSYGNASGPPPAIDPLELSRRGSLFLTRPTLFNYIARREELDAAARELFAAVNKGVLRVRVGQRYALSAAAEAHRDLQARRTTGSTVLIP